MAFQLIGNTQNIVSSYRDGFIYFYYPEALKGVIQQSIGTFRPFGEYISQEPIQGRLSPDQKHKMDTFVSTLVVDTKGLVWRIVPNNKPAPSTLYLNKRLNEGTTNEQFGSQTSLKNTTEFDYTGSDYLGSVKSLKEKGMLS